MTKGCERCEERAAVDVIVTIHYDGPPHAPRYRTSEPVCKRCWQLEQDKLMALLKERASQAFSNFSKGG
jgi:hypothetical protein